MTSASTILAVDDEPKALILLRHLAEPEGHRVLTAERGADALALAQREHPDVILLDVMMPDMDGFEVCRRLRADPALATVPIILLTALDDRESRLRGLEAGADDFVTKPFDGTELRIRLRTLRRLNRYRRLHEESSRFEAALDHSPEAIVIAELDGTLLRHNPAFLRLLAPGHPRPDNFFDLLGTADAATLRAGLARATPPAGHLEFTLPAGYASPTIVEVACGLVPWEGRRAVLFHLRDLTDKKALENQLLRAQRIELLGQLSSSVAHDLNNVLAAIGGSAGLLEIAPHAPTAPKHLTNIRAAVQRGASMLQQLLQFGRGSDGPMEPLNPVGVAAEVGSLVRESFGARYELGFDAEPNLPAIVGDSTQIHQVVMNLCVNARDAMPDGGEILLSVRPLDVTPELAAQGGPGARAGRHVVISVRDRGTGIPPHVRARLFDPFFTTKAEGKGTGLGLATVLRVMRRHGGFVTLETEVGQGTCFYCHFPVAPDAPAV